MIVEIITTGTELLLGEIDNENSRWLAVFLNQHGFTVAYMTTVGDNAMRMRNAMENCIVSGRYSNYIRRAGCDTRRHYKAHRGRSFRYSLCIL